MDLKYLKDLEPALSPLTVCEEAARCLLCEDAPCSNSCPAGTDPGRFIRAVRFRNFKGAAEIIRENNVLGAICARVCPQEKYCQKGCSRSGIDKPILIGQIQRYVTDVEEALKMDILVKGEPNGKKVAIVGSGPSGLTLAAELLKKGCEVDIYEKEEKLGGYMRYGIPTYRLSNHIIDVEIERLIKLGLKIHTNVLIGKDISIAKLEEKHDAVVIATGFNEGKVIPMFLNNPFVETGVEFLKRVKENNGNTLIEDNVLVIGGGDVAMDVSTTLKILGATHVSDVVYEELHEFKASEKELEGARKLGVTIIDGYVPHEVKGNSVTFKHRHIPGELTLSADKIILAVGQKANVEGLDLELDRGEAKATHYQTSNPKVWVSGDLSTNKEKTVVGCVKNGKEVAYYLCKFLGVK
ncbi:MAG: FAD-dependent oxidoreductase [Erysipelotrichaceae bacterium]|jgi:dihydropyrimidine dehydrogenase (NAD+) subunit PreT|nr:FAD-dependent oxidoreductase [Erysipelotrichaceae bacterium]